MNCSMFLKSAGIYAVLLAVLFSTAGCMKLKRIDTSPAKTVIAEVKKKPSGGGLEFRRDDFFEDDVTIALGSAWLTSPSLKKAKLFFFGLDEVKPSGGKPKDLLRFVVKKDSSLDVGISDVFGAKLSDSNAITITVNKRSMTTTISQTQLQKWAESASKLISGDEAYVAFAMKITESLINTEEYTKKNYSGGLSYSAIKIGNAAYGSTGEVKTTEPVIWVGLIGCKWIRDGGDGKPAITIVPPEDFQKVLPYSMLVK